MHLVVAFNLNSDVISIDLNNKEHMFNIANSCIYLTDEAKDLECEFDISI